MFWQMGMTKQMVSGNVFSLFQVTLSCQKATSHSKKDAGLPKKLPETLFDLQQCEEAKTYLARPGMLNYNTAQKR